MMNVRWDDRAVLVGTTDEGDQLVREGGLTMLIDQVLALPVAIQDRYAIVVGARPEVLDITTVRRLRCRPDYPVR